jgi:hypothetical protein
MRWIHIVTPDHERYDGVRPIQIFLMRVGYLLVFLLVGIRSWTLLIAHRGDWDPLGAAAVSMWASSSLLSVIGVCRPLKMLPLLLFEIGYKVIWLVAVAWPLWAANRFTGSPAEDMTYAFLPVVAPIALVPWGYVFRTYGWRR